MVRLILLVFLDSESTSYTQKSKTFASLSVFILGIGAKLHRVLELPRLRHRELLLLVSHLGTSTLFTLFSLRLGEDFGESRLSRCANLSITRDYLLFKHLTLLAVGVSAAGIDPSGNGSLRRQHPHDFDLVSLGCVLDHGCLSKVSPV